MNVKFCRRSIFVLGVFLTLLWSVQAEVADRIVAVVNDDVITLHDLTVAFEPFLKNIEKTYPGNNRETVIRQNQEMLLQRLIDNLLIEQEARKNGGGISVKEEEVMDVLEDMLAKQKLSMQDFLRKLTEEGSSIEAVKKEIRSQMIRIRLLRRELGSKISVSDSEIGAYYLAHREDYEGKESIRIKQLSLLFSDRGDEREKAKLKKEALHVRELIRRGESFDALIAKYSQEPGKTQGGDAGFIEKGTLIPEIESVAFGLPVGQVSDVIESGKGFHIIKVLDKRGAGLKPIAVVREEIRTKIEEEKLEKKFEEWIAAVRARSHIDVRF